MTSAAERWRIALDDWAIPAAILAAAPENPWIHPTALFDVPEEIAPTPSHAWAREAMPAGGIVLDVGCGGGVASFAVTPPAALVIGVDQQPEMLALYRANAQRRRVRCRTIDGLWPDVADEAPVADVVAAHHVVYNVGDIVPFLRALDGHARGRVVVEMPDRHPLSSMNDAWRHFWQLERPAGPTPTDLMEVLNEMGIDAHREQWRGVARVAPSPELAARYLRVRLCLPASREDEVREFLSTRTTDSERETSTLWWDAATT